MLREGPGGSQDNRRWPSDEDVEGTKQGARELIGLGDIYVGAASYESAVDCFSRALKLLPLEGAPEERASVLRKITYCLGKLGRNQEAEAYIEEAEETAQDISDVAEKARILIEKGKLDVVGGRLDLALSCAEKARSLLAETPENKERGFAENLLGNVLMRMGKQEESRRCFLASLDFFKRAGDIRTLALAYNNLGLVFKNACDWPRAIEYLQVALNLQAVEGEYHGRSQQIQNLGVIQLKMGNWKSAQDSFEQCLQIGREVSDPLRVLRALIGLAAVHRITRTWALAAGDLQQARELLEEHAFAREDVLVEKSLGEVAFDQGDLDTAERHFEKAWSLANRTEAGEDVICELLRLRAELALERKDSQKALALARNARQAAKDVGDRFEAALSWRVMALASSARGTVAEANAAFESGIQELKEIGEKYTLG
ncbi:MAG: tetratricopeptide repeat protein, partial [Candidatus Eisenbacteria bacterium]